MDSHLAGVAIALDLQSHRQVFGGGPSPSPDWPYFKALADVIGGTARTARAFNERPDETDDLRLEFTFDSRIESNGTAGTLYTMLSNQPEWAESGLFDTKIAFESGKREPRLEIADLLARESMKELDRTITQAPRPMRGSRRALEESGKFKFVVRGREYWEELRQFVLQPESVALAGQFEDWLRRTGRVQDGKIALNMQNWIVFNSAR